MDDKSKHVGKFLETVAINNKKFIKLAEHLRSQFNVLSVSQNINCQQFESSVVLELSVDAELRNGKAVCWWLELNWTNKQWVIDTCVLVNHNQGQDKLKDFPNKLPETFEEFIVEFNKSTDELIYSFNEINLAV